MIFLTVALVLSIIGNIMLVRSQKLRIDDLNRRTLDGFINVENALDKKVDK